jgi:hypothetical protein
MEGILSQLGQRIADRWLALFVLPGLPFTIVLACAGVLGQGHALSTGTLSDRLDSLVDRWADSTATAFVHITGAFLVAALAGLMVRSAARGMAALWGGKVAWLRPLTRRNLRRRRSRAEAAPPVGYRVPQRYLPCSPTWTMDRFRLTDERVVAQYGIQLALAWPRIWQIADIDTRVAVQTAWQQYTAAQVQGTWGLAYLCVSPAWWPAGIIGLVLTFMAWLRGRDSAGAFAELVEATVDTHLIRLAEALGIELMHGRFTAQDGILVNSILDKGSVMSCPDHQL